MVEEIEGAHYRGEIAFDYFVSAIPEVVGIARFHDYGQLARFLLGFEGICDHTEFHLILDQIPSVSNLRASDQCAPCVFSQSLRRPQGPDLELERDPGMACRHCGRYLRQPDRNPPLKLRVDLRSKAALRPRVRIAVIDLALEGNDLIAIGAIPGNCPSPEYETDEAWRRMAIGKRLGKELYDHVIASQILRSAHIIVVPEYCVPLHAMQEFVRLYAKWSEGSPLPPMDERFIVLGSHLDQEGFNVAPIVHRRGREIRVYFQHKQVLAEREKPWVRRRGSGTLVFRSSLGNLCVRVCKDEHDRDLDLIRDVNIVLCPAYHPGSKDTLPDFIKHKVELSQYVVAFANGAQRERSRGGKKHFAPRAASFIKCAHEKETVAKLGDKGSELKLLHFKAPLVDREVSLLKLDQARVPYRQGAAAEGIVPLHVDDWAKTDRKRLESDIERRLDSIRKEAEDKGGKLEDYWMIDWGRAEKEWRTIATQNRRDRRHI